MFTISIVSFKQTLGCLLVNLRVFIKLQVWYYSVRSRKIKRDQTAFGATMLKCTLRLQNDKILLQNTVNLHQVRLD